MTWTTVLAAFCLGAAPAPAQATAIPDADAVLPNELAIPFEPPLGETLLYRYTRADTRSGQTRSRSIDMRFRFARDGENYAMTVDYVVPAESAPVDPAALLMRRALVVRISMNGEVLGLVDEDAYWDALQAAIRAAVRQGADAPEVRARLEAFLGRLRALPPEERLALMTENFLPIFGAAGAVLPLDEEVEHTEVRDTAVGTLTQRSRIRTEQVGADRARLTTVMTIPNNEVARAMADMFRELVPEQAVGQQFQVTAFEDRTILVVSLATGLAERWEMRRVVEFEAGGAATRVEQLRTLERRP